MRFFRDLAILVFYILLLSCNSSSDNPIVEETLVNANDFNATIDENPNLGDIIGKVEATTNKDKLFFSLDSQFPNNSVTINSQTGELRVANKSEFNFEVNTKIEGVIKIASEDVMKKITFNIDINDIIEPTEYTLINNSNTEFNERYRHRSIVFKDKIWVIGGGVKNNGRTNDILTTSDGQNWEKINVVGDIFPPVHNHEIIVFNNKIWLIGGKYGIDNESNEVWYTDNGTNWTKSNKNFPTKILKHNIKVFKNKLWAYGGYDPLRLSQKLWSSVNGIDWVEETNSNFPLVAYHDIVSFNNKLWLIGGYDSFHLNEVWSSSDGINWTKETLNPNMFSPRSSHQVINFLDKTWVIGGIYHEGQSARALNEIWSSPNGIDWTKENITTTNTTSNYFNAVFNHEVLIYKDKIWIMGGQISSSGYGIGNIWHSN